MILPANTMGLGAEGLEEGHPFKCVPRAMWARVVRMNSKRGECRQGLFWRSNGWDC